jgi:hypothetical protein
MVNDNLKSRGEPGNPDELSIDTCPIDQGGASKPGATADPKFDDPSSGGGNQQIALASYIHPKADSEMWTRMLTLDSKKLTLLVANVLNGPDNVRNIDWDPVIRDTVKTGKKIIGYVRTGYLGVSVQGFQTRLGSRRLSDWLAQMQLDVQMWYRLYPDMGGIFFDEGWNECGKTKDSNEWADFYNFLNAWVKKKYPNAYTVLNPGDYMPKCFEHSSDTLLTYESSYERYLDPNIYKPLPDWKNDDSRKIWHIVYQVPPQDIKRIAALARERGAGLIQITDKIMPNPYDKLPSPGYMQAHMDAVAGGNLKIEPPPGPAMGSIATGPTYNPRDLTVVSYDYSSVTLKWSAVGAQFEVLVSDGNSYVLQGGMKEVTIPGLYPEKTYTFQVNAQGEDGRTWESTEKQTVTTRKLPAEGPIIDYFVVSSADHTTVRASVLLPYAFVRLYFWDGTECDSTVDPAWPIVYDMEHHVCAKYLIENEVLYKYNAPKQPREKNAEWLWDRIYYGEKLKVTQDWYDFTWEIPMGTSTFDINRFVIDAAGYSKGAKAFHPRPDEFNCKDVSSLCDHTLHFDKWCDDAANNKLKRNNDILYASRYVPFSHTISRPTFSSDWLSNYLLHP